MSLLDDIVIHYPLQDPSGDALDAVGSNDLTEFNSPGTATGKVGNCRSFDRSSSQYFGAASNSDFQAGDIDFEVSCWVKLGTTSTRMMIIAKDSADSREYFLAYGNNGPGFSFCLFEAGGGAREVVQAESAPSEDVWYFLRGGYDSVNNEVYLRINEGTPNTYPNSTGVYVGDAEFRVGARQYSGFADYFDGLIDEPNLRKRIVSDAEGAEVYNAGAGLPFSSYGGSSPTTIEPTSITSAESVGSPTLTAGPVSIAPSSIASAESVGTPTLTPGSVTVSPSSIASGESVGSPTLSAGAVTVTPSSIGSAESVGSPALAAGAVTITPTSIGSAESVGVPTLTPGAVTITPTSIPSAESVGSPVLSTPGSVVIVPESIPSAESVGTPTLTPGPVTVSPVSISSAGSVGTPVLTPGVVVISPVSIPSAESVGTPVLSTPGAIVPTSIPSAESVGIPTLIAGPVTISPVSIPSAGSVGVPTLTGSPPSTTPGRARPDPRSCTLRSSDPNPRKVVLR